MISNQTKLQELYCKRHVAASYEEFNRIQEAIVALERRIRTDYIESLKEDNKAA